ncbi:hypothetical protein [Brevundimonas mediterranea]|uniref:NERD domain-containing protein n=1 Tax=Brevundimonas mediterranea TaxID=74329 RepID=A0A7W6A1S7_9CAUL|nr:hypothetical protein [Brevundimonas mediterranea]MBB3871666.1 hypothetical protein [Brevundimonas mediterranea]
MKKTSASLTRRDEILIRVAMDHEDIEIAGLAGEFAASCVFDQAGVGWIDLGQRPDHHSTFLKSLTAHRPDYLVFYGGGSILIDVKTYRPRQQGSEGHLFGITSVDRNDLKATQNASGIPVALLFWNRLAYGRFEYRICLLDDLLVPHTDDKGTEWLCRDFSAEELTTTRLAAS